jgi:hypothetical protein
MFKARLKFQAKFEHVFFLAELSVRLNLITALGLNIYTMNATGPQGW